MDIEISSVLWWNPVTGRLTLSCGVLEWIDNEDCWAIANHLAGDAAGTYTFIQEDWIHEITTYGARPKLELIKGGKDGGDL